MTQKADQLTQNNQPLSSPLHVLLVEGDEHEAALFEQTLQKAPTPYHVSHYKRAEEAIEQLQFTPSRFKIIATAYKLPGMSGLDLCRRLINEQVSLPLLILVEGGTEATEAVKIGVEGYLVKDPEQGYLTLLPVVLSQLVSRHAERLALQQTETALREAEAILKQYMHNLETQNADLEAFAHTVAHDLRGPLTQIIGLADALDLYYSTMTFEEIKQYLSAIVRNGRKVNNIIDELLLLATVRKEEVVLSPLDMESIVAEALQRLSYMIETYGAKIILPDSWPIALGRGPWIEEVWVNYISNGIKYGGRPPCVELGATTQPDGQIRFWVRDNGPGLTPEEQAKLFVPFTRLGKVRVKGYGLGLSIVQRIIEKLGGHVNVESAGALDQGSIFFFTLPAV
jgi:two-component system, sensor histidine kinase and response regulator